MSPLRNPLYRVCAGIGGRGVKEDWHSEGAGDAVLRVEKWQILRSQSQGGGRGPGWSPRR